MCGIAGFTTKERREFDTLLEKMAVKLTHRGPDDVGYWVDTENGVGLTHRRLSIIDLSKSGHQPMTSHNERYIISFNGEIYNHLQIRKEINNENRTCVSNGKNWNGTSDTETLLNAIECWGVHRALQKSIGMFSFALWDRQEKKLVLARDRMGEKPLYYGWLDDCFVFASELKSVRAFSESSCEINRNALTLYMRHNYIPAPYSIYNYIYKLMPGSVITLSQSGREQCPWDYNNPPRSYYRNNGVTIEKYWEIEKTITADDKLNIPEEDAVDELENLLKKSIRLQQISDVPLGAFLSGGIDSSTIVALMQAEATNKIKTFSVGYGEESFNEAVYAKDVAEYIGTDHNELIVTAQDALNVIPAIPKIYDEPFSDQSQIPTYLIAKFAKTQVTVALSGDAGDELFYGYNRYFFSRKIFNIVRMMDIRGRRLLVNALQLFAPGNVFRRNKINRAMELLSFEHPVEFYRVLMSHWKKPDKIVIGATEPRSIFENETEKYIRLFDEKMTFTDMTNYLPDDILVKVDRAAMAVSLETRVPLLDYRIVEFANRLPMSLKRNRDAGKWILRQVLYRHVPKKLVERPKRGFGIPIDSWLRGPLREWAESLLSENRIKSDGYFNCVPIRELWNDYLSGTSKIHYYLWDVLMFQSWLRNLKN